MQWHFHAEHSCRLPPFNASYPAAPPARCWRPCNGTAGRQPGSRRQRRRAGARLLPPPVTNAIRHEGAVGRADARYQAGALCICSALSWPTAPCNAGEQPHATRSCKARQRTDPPPRLGCLTYNECMVARLLPPLSQLQHLLDLPEAGPGAAGVERDMRMKEATWAAAARPCRAPRTTHAPAATHTLC